MKNLNKNIKRLIAIGTLTAVTDIFMNMFLTAKIYEMANNATHTISVYYIIQYLCIATTFLVFGNTFKVKPVRSLRFGIVLNFILLMFIMLANSNLMNYYLMIAVVFGIAQGAYYAPYSVLIGTYNNDTLRYCTISNLLYNLVSVVFPITIGAYITTTSFSMASICMVILAVVQIILSMGIEKVEGKSKYNLIKFVKYIKNSKTGKKVVNYYAISFLKGITSSVLDRTVLILIMMLFGSQFELGALNTIFAISTIVTTWLVKQFYCKEKATKMIVLSGIIPMINVILLIIWTNTISFIFYKICVAVFICILSLLADMDRYDCLEDGKCFETEHQALCELTLAGGRIFGLTVLLIVNNLIGGLFAIKVMLFVIGIAIMAYAYYINKTTK